MNDYLLNDICDAINNYNSRSSLSDEEKEKSLQYLIKTMFSFLKEIVKSGNFKDDFDYVYSVGSCVFVSAISGKTKSQYTFLYDMFRGTIAFETSIDNSNNLRYLQEDFLLEFFHTMQQYNIQYTQTEFCEEAEKMHPDLYKTKKGNLLRLMRNYYLGIAYKKDEWPYTSDLYLGKFEVEWKPKRGMNEIFEESCIAMKWLYKLNYNLWKVVDLKEKSDKKRFTHPTRQS